MKIRFLLPLLLLAAAGCEKEVTGPSDPVTAKPALDFQSPELDKKTSLSIPLKHQWVQVGDPWDSVKDEFTQPKSAFASADLPPNFPAGFTAKEWETGKEGLGAILYKDQLAVVLHQYEHCTATEFDSFFSSLRDAHRGIKFSSMLGQHVKYYFWTQDKQILMLCGLYTKHNLLHVTIALGVDKVLAELGIDPQTAPADAKKVDAMFSSKTS